MSKAYFSETKYKQIKSCQVQSKSGCNVLNQKSELDKLRVEATRCLYRVTLRLPNVRRKSENTFRAPMHCRGGMWMHAFFVFVTLVLLYGQEFLGKATPAIAMDGVVIILSGVYLFAVRMQRPKA